MTHVLLKRTVLFVTFVLCWAVFAAVIAHGAPADASPRGVVPFSGFAPGTMMQDRVARIPVGRAGVPDDVAAVVAFLASEGSGYVNGQSINICGGLLMN